MSSRSRVKDQHEEAPKLQRIRETLVSRIKSDPNKLVGFSEDEAIRFLSGFHLSIKVIERDGNSCVTIDDYDINRAYVSVVNGKITKVHKWC
jgi:hypothetical protein